MAQLSQIQKLTTTIASTDTASGGGSGDTVSPTVTTTKTIVFWTYTTDEPDNESNLVSLHSFTGSNIRFERHASSGTINITAYIAEFDSGVAVEHQTGLTGLNTDNDVEAATLTTFANTMWVMGSMKKSGTNFDTGEFVAYGLYDSSGTVCKITEYTSANPSSAANCGIQIIDYDDCTVQRNSTASDEDRIISTGTTGTTSITAPSANKGMLQIHHTSEEAISNQLDIGMIDAKFTQTTNPRDTITYIRHTSDGSNIEVFWQVITFSDDTTVQHDTVTFPDLDGAESITLGTSLADSGANAVAISTIALGRGQGEHTDNDIVGAFQATFDITSATNVDCARDHTDGETIIQVQTIDFPVAAGGAAHNPYPLLHQNRMRRAA